MRHLDYRRMAQQARRCGFDPDDQATWSWWVRLDPQEREGVLAVCDPRHAHYAFVPDPSPWGTPLQWVRIPSFPGEPLLMEMEGQSWGREQDLFRFEDLVRSAEEYPDDKLPQTFHRGGALPMSVRLPPSRSAA